MFPTLICSQTVPAVDTDVTVIQSCDNNPAPTGQINTSSQSETSVNMDVTRDESNRVASQVILYDLHCSSFLFIPMGSLVS